MASSRNGAARIGAWNVGSCPRKLWYGEHGVVPDQVDNRAILVFQMGDMVEDQVLDLMISVGAPLIRTNEKRDTFTLNIAGRDVRMRSDAFFDLDGIHLPVDVKSCSDKGYARYSRGEISDDYLAQIECYMRGYNVDHGGFVFVRKSTSQRCFIPVKSSDKVWKMVEKNVLLAIGDQIPDRPYRPLSICEDAPVDCVNGKTPKQGKEHAKCGGTGRYTIKTDKYRDGKPVLASGEFIPNFPCGYCGYMNRCWADRNPELLYTNTSEPRWRCR